MPAPPSRLFDRAGRRIPPRSVRLLLKRRARKIRLREVRRIFNRRCDDEMRPAVGFVGSIEILGQDRVGAIWNAVPANVSRLELRRDHLQRSGRRRGTAAYPWKRLPRRLRNALPVSALALRSAE